MADTIPRRRALALAGTAVATGLAGCGGGGGGGDSTTESEPSTTTTTATTGAPTTTTSTTPEASTEETTPPAPTSTTGETTTQESTTSTGEGAGGGTTTVEMVDTSFSPVRAAVEPATTVEWVNRDSYGHDVVAGTFHEVAATWNVRSDRIGPGGTVTHTFEEPGVYEYYCSIHGRAAMCGAVLVGDVTLDERLPCE